MKKDKFHPLQRLHKVKLNHLNQIQTIGKNTKNHRNTMEEIN